MLETQNNNEYTWSVVQVFKSNKSNTGISATNWINVLVRKSLTKDRIYQDVSHTHPPRVNKFDDKQNMKTISTIIDGHQN